MKPHLPPRPRHSPPAAAPRHDVDVDAKTWLKAHGYHDYYDRIVALEKRWLRLGKKTRRDWWLVLAGSPSGKPRRIDGESFPILAAARRRQGYPVLATAEQRSPRELAPPVRAQVGRWGARFRRATG